MNNYKLEDMKRGWFIGNFEPTILHTNSCEVAVKHFKAGEKEKKHLHKIATEISVIISGSVIMGESKWSAGDIVEVAAGEAIAFEALEDSILVVVKVPGASNDKYIV